MFYAAYVPRLLKSRGKSTTYHKFVSFLVSPSVEASDVFGAVLMVQTP